MEKAIEKKNRWKYYSDWNYFRYSLVCILVYSNITRDYTKMSEETESANIVIDIFTILCFQLLPRNIFVSQNMEKDNDAKNKGIVSNPMVNILEIIMGWNVASAKLIATPMNIIEYTSNALDLYLVSPIIRPNVNVILLRSSIVKIAETITSNNIRLIIAYVNCARNEYKVSSIKFIQPIPNIAYEVYLYFLYISFFIPF